jgi:hypothetical protein
MASWLRFQFGASVAAGGPDVDFVWEGRKGFPKGKETVGGFVPLWPLWSCQGLCINAAPGGCSSAWPHGPRKHRLCLVIPPEPPVADPRSAGTARSGQGGAPGFGAALANPLAGEHRSGIGLLSDDGRLRRDHEALRVILLVSLERGFRTPRNWSCNITSHTRFEQLFPPRGFPLCLLSARTSPGRRGGPGVLFAGFGRARLQRAHHTLAFVK